MQYLTEISPEDRKFQAYKFSSLQIAKLITSPDLQKYRQRMEKCANHLRFAVTSEGFKLRQGFYYSKTGKKIPMTKFCRVLGCPMCQWRRSKMWQSRAFKSVPKLLEQNTTHSFLFLTLTVTSPAYQDLRETIDKMQNAFHRMSYKNKNNTRWISEGHIKTLEITKGKILGKCHPHFHCLLLMPNRYFYGSDGGYMNTNAWKEMWAEYMDLSYLPQVKINEVKGDYKKVIPEIFKYQTKPADFEADPEFLEVYMRQIHRVRSLELAGAFRKYFKEDTLENQDLINPDESLSEQSDIFFDFKWSSEEFLNDKILSYKLAEI